MPLLHVAVAVRRDAANVKRAWGETTTEAKRVTFQLMQKVLLLPKAWMQRMKAVVF